jgi:hypothetical protein
MLSVMVAAVGDWGCGIAAAATAVAMRVETAIAPRDGVSGKTTANSSPP